MGARWGVNRAARKGRGGKLVGAFCPRCDADRGFLDDRCMVCKARRPKDSKFGNVPDTCRQGVRHHSKREAAYCNTLHNLLNAGAISELRAHPQPRYDLHGLRGEVVATVVPDFEFVDEKGRLRTHDVKGVLTSEAALKYRLFAQEYGREVELVKR